MHFFEVNGGKTQKTKPAQQSQKQTKSPQEQIEDINKEIERLRNSLDIYSSGEDFGRIQAKIKELEDKRYQIMVKNRLK